MITPADCVFYIPSGLKTFKLDLFERIARHIGSLGGRSVRRDDQLYAAAATGKVPIVGCSPELTGMIAEWKRQARPYIYWDRGYCRRIFATWLPRGDAGGYYRWHVGSYQMLKLRSDAREDRWKSLKTPVTPWKKDGRHVVVARPSKTYMRFHRIEGWLDKVVYELSLVTDRQLVVRDKESKRPLAADLEGAHCLVTHGSNAAVEAAIMGCPVFVDPSSAAALVGLTNLSMVEKPIYPEREPWLHSLAYCQYNERELVDGTLWRLLR